MKRFEKGWGHELIWANFLGADGRGYTGKILRFDKSGKRFSLHFHREKAETWLVTKGRFQIVYVRTHDGSREAQVLEVGDSWHNAPGQPHQLIALEDHSDIVEVSTPDDASDNFRIQPGDSQWR